MIKPLKLPDHYANFTLFGPLFGVLGDPCALFAKTSPGVASALLVIYPAWDVIGTILDIRANHNSLSKTPQYNKRRHQRRNYLSRSRGFAKRHP